MSDWLARHDVAERVEKELDRLYDNYYQEAAVIDTHYAQLIRDMHDFIKQGGKRLRSYLTYIGYTGQGGQDTDAIMPVAASQEVLHNFLLIHDDIIDRDETRYHGLNISGRYRRSVAGDCSEEAAVHYGRSVALLAGDINHIFAHRLLLDSDFLPRDILSALRWLDTKILEVAGGEFLDVYLAMGIEPPQQQQLLNVMRYKTAAYSFECPLVLGAILAGADQRVQEAISELAVPLGIAYQLQDDLLGMFGDSEDTGKPSTSDLEEGKHTLLLHYGFQTATQEQTRILKAVLQNPHITQIELHEVQQVLRDTGAYERVQEEIEGLFSKAESALPVVLNQEAVQALEELMQKMRNRIT